MRRPPLAIYVVLLGVVVGIVRPVGDLEAWGLATAGLATAWWPKGRYTLLGFVLLGVGAGGLASQTAGRPAPIAALAPAWCRIEGRVLERAGGLGTLVGVDRVECGPRAAIDAGVVAVDGRIGESGSILSAEGYLTPLRDRAFERARVRAGADAAFEVSALDLEPPASWPHIVAGGFRRALRAAMLGVDEERAALLRGLTIGETEGLSEATEERVRRAGLSHLVAVSGSNVALVLGAVLWGARRFPRTVRHLAAAATLFLFVIVVGPDPSVLRAAAMGAVTLVGLTAHVRSDPLGALGVALVVLLILRPGILYSVGLHLSVAATLGIVLFARPLLARMRWLPRPMAIVMAATLAAQFAVAPILIIVFGELSVVAPIANLLALGAVPFATAATAVAGLVHSLVPVAGRAFAYIAEPFGWWILEVARLGDLSWAAVEVAPAWGWALGAVVVPAMGMAIRYGPTPPVGSAREGASLGPEGSLGRGAEAHRGVFIARGS